MPHVQYQVVDHIAEILLDRAPVNAVVEPMIDALLDCLHQARHDANVRAVIIGSATPGQFCAGLDIKAFAGSSAESTHDLLEKLYSRVNDAQYHLGKPSIAAVAGAARGAGMTLAISCDLIVAEASASFGYPEIDVGLIPAIHFAHLHRVVGKHRAFDLLFTGRRFSTQEAYELGLVSRRVDDGTALAAARELARVLAGKAPTIMRMGRAAFVRECDSDYRRGVAAAVENFCSLAGTEEAREGVRAFIEKRPPSWRTG